MTHFQKAYTYINTNYKVVRDDLGGKLWYFDRRRPRDIKPLDIREFTAMMRLKFSNLKQVDVGQILAHIKKGRKNEPKRYLESLEGRELGSNPFDDLATYFEMEDAPPYKFSDMLLWHFVRAIVCLYTGKPNKQIFVLASILQNIGKTTFLNWLQPQVLSKYCMCTFAGRKEKWPLLACTMFLINADELANLTNDKNPEVMALLTGEKSTMFVPFKNETIEAQRTASFFASTNLTDGVPILTPGRGSSRHIIFNVKSINFDYQQNIDVNDLWAYAYKIYKSGIDCQLPLDVVKEIEEYNKRFAIAKSKPKFKKRYTKKFVIGASAAAAAIASTLMLAVRYFIV